MVRDAAKRDFALRILVPGGEGDAEDPGGLHRIVEKHFVEVAASVKKYGVGVVGFYLKILPHHRCNFGHVGTFAGGKKRAHPIKIALPCKAPPQQGAIKRVSESRPVADRFWEGVAEVPLPFRSAWAGYPRTGGTLPAKLFTAGEGNAYNGVV